MIVIGTRGSKLALVQARWVSSELTKRNQKNEIKIIKTKGDIVQDRFDKMEGKGFFTNEIEAALRRGEIDVAVHCLKDLPTASPEGLEVRAIPTREDPYDVIISAKPRNLHESGFPDLTGLVVGTSSNRRVYALSHYFPTATFSPIRGNVPTRIAKMVAGEADVVVLARAGLNRLKLDLSKYHVFCAEPPLLIPAPGQGALALQTRVDYEGDIAFFHDEETATCVNHERRILSAMDGGCQLPLGVLIHRHKDAYRLEIFLGAVPGSEKDKTDACFFLSLNGATPENLADQALTLLKNTVLKG